MAKSSNIALIEFHGDTLWAMERDGEVYVAISPICKGMGLNPDRQRDRVQRDTILSEGATMMVVPSAGGMQETMCLRLDLVNGWLFGIDDKRVKPEARDTVLRYKRECYRVLYEHFHGAAAARVAERAEQPALPPRDFARVEAHLHQHQMRVLAAARMLEGAPVSWGHLADVAGLSRQSVERAAELLDALELIQIRRR